MAVDKKVYEELAKIQGQIAALEKEAKPLMELIKNDMIINNQNSMQECGINFTLTTSERNTIKDKDNLLLYLVQNDLKSCIDTEIKPNVDRLKDAVKQGKLPQTILDQYVKTTKTNTFKMK